MNIIKSYFQFKQPLSKRQSTKYIIIHHRGGDGDVESIHRLHLKNGYSGIGYHFYIRKDGQVFQGRPKETVGAHCLNNNYNSVGVCFEGNFENEEAGYAQKKAGAELILYLKKLYPDARVVCHRDMLQTACPGKNFPIDEVKGGVKEEKILTSANDIAWELSQKIEILDIDSFVRALESAEKVGSPLYWGYYKIVNGQGAKK